MRNWLQDKYVIVTGASGGIGKELCKLFIEKYGANVIGIARNEEKIIQLQNELKEKSSAFSYRLFDVSQKQEWQNFAAFLKEQNIRPALLVNNAGMFPSFRKVVDTPSSVTEKVLAVNYFSIVYATEALLPLLSGDKKDKPAIVNVSSSASLCTVVGTSAYSASKRAVQGYTEALQLEEKGKTYVGIVYPGTTATDLFSGDKNTQNSALDLIAMPAPKMAKKIAKRILKKKKRSVLGWDAKLMNLSAKLFPVKGVGLICSVMKASHSKVFSEVFQYKKKKKNKSNW